MNPSTCEPEVSRHLWQIPELLLLYQRRSDADVQVETPCDALSFDLIGFWDPVQL